MKSLKFCAASAIALVATHFRTPSAEAASLLEEDRDYDECEAVGGQIAFQNDPLDDTIIFVCDTPKLDALCKAAAENDGRDSTFIIFDLHTRSCREIQSDCFLTTACCTEMGLSDTCWELTQLRRFRDEVLVHMPNGPHDIERYYNTAPRILEQIPRSAARAENLYIYSFVVLPCAILIKLGRYNWARTIYTRCMTRLMETYLA